MIVASVSHARLLACATALVIALPGCTPAVPEEAPRVLLFVGAGTSSNDVSAIEALMRKSDIAYATATSAELNAMNTAQLTSYRLVIIPGGNFITMGDSLTATSRAALHDAVQSGLNYLGICAGAFLAGEASYNSLALTPGVRFPFYADAARGLRKSVVAITTVSGPPLEHYWEDGPQLSGWGTVAAKYPDGTPAVVQGKSGQGWVILTGIHSEAPESWRRGMRFTTPASVDNAYARVLIEAALNGKALPHF